MKYLPTILIRGLVIPLMAFLIVGALVGTGTSIFQEEARKRQERYDGYVQNKAMVDELKKRVLPNLWLLNVYRNLADGDQYTKIGEDLRVVESTLGSDVLRRTMFRKGKTPSAFAGAVTQPTEVIEVSFDGTFRTIQEAHLNLEIHRPNVFLEGFKLDFKDANPQLGYPQPYIQSQSRYTVFATGDGKEK